VDEIYDALIVRPIVWLSREILWKRIDQQVMTARWSMARRAARAPSVGQIAGCRRGRWCLRRCISRRCAAPPVAGHELMYATWVLTALLAWPLLAGAIVMVVPSRMAKYAALVASLIEFAISVPLWWTFIPAPACSSSPITPGSPRGAFATRWAWTGFRCSWCCSRRS